MSSRTWQKRIQDILQAIFWNSTAYSREIAAVDAHQRNPGQSDSCIGKS